MKFSLLPFALSYAPYLITAATTIPFRQLRRSASLGTRAPDASNTTNQLNLITSHDLIYIVDITVADQDFLVQLDTGSSDLWIKPPSYPLSGAHETNTTYNLTYAIGWAYGTVAFAPVEFANLSVRSQAFLDVSHADNPALSYGVNGIVGLGFTSRSTVDGLVNITGESSGRSLLYNLFHTNTQELNFLAFSLQRSADNDGSQVQGSFSIGEYDPDFAAVADCMPISTWPVDCPTRWNVLLDSVIVSDSILLPSTTVDDAPSNKAVVLMDSGSSYSYISKEICDAIYSHIEGAHFDEGLSQWIVPCDCEIDMALQINGQVFPLHPLDVIPNGLVNASTCVGSFVPQTSSASDDFDWIIGVNFLRSVYSVYNFGEFDDSGSMSDPHVKLLSLVDPVKASQDFHEVRGGTPKTNISYKGIEGAALTPSSSLSKNVESSIQTVSHLVPAILGVAALNFIILVILAIAGTVYFCRKRRASRVSARTPRGRMSPMQMNPRHTYIAGNSSTDTSHTYQPVSIALTEDTFVPPSPAFHQFNGKPDDRPKSVA